MLTVTVGLVLSGKSSTLRPLGRRYSVMPSTAWTFLMALTAIALPSFGACGMGLRFAPVLGVTGRRPSSGPAGSGVASGAGAAAASVPWRGALPCAGDGVAPAAGDGAAPGVGAWGCVLGAGVPLAGGWPAAGVAPPLRSSG